MARIFIGQTAEEHVDNSTIKKTKMVKIQSPLFSLEARGTIAKSLTFSERKTGAQVRWQKKQKDVQSVERLEQREKFLSASNAARFYEVGTIILGNFVFGVDIEDYNIEAKYQPFSGYNLATKQLINYF